MKPARTRSLWLATCASAGASFSVGTKAFESRTVRMGVGLYTLVVPRRLRNGLLAAAALLVAGGVAWDAGLRPPPRLEPTAQAIARGRAFVRGHCLHCHAAIPPFPGSEDDRRDVASYLAALGAGAAEAP